MWKHLASNTITLLVVVAIAVGIAVAWGQREFTEPGPLAQPICFEVPRGASLSRVSDDLGAKGAVTSPMIFRIGADYADKAEALKFGSYLIPAGASMSEIVDTITESRRSTCGLDVNFRIGVADAEIVVRELDPVTNRYEEIVEFSPGVDEVPAQYSDLQARDDLRWRVTLAEGVTSWQVVEALKQADFLSGEVAQVPPEGSLAPDSYEVERGRDRSDLLAEMSAAQTRTLAELWEQRASDLPYSSPQEALVMASIVEKETGIADERPLVASVFVNRLRDGMRLQTDPAVIYGITEGRGTLGRGLRQSELRAATPYNTYVIEGLPPTPIANPGRLSIEAALNPAQSDYFFFVADGTGGHAFAETLEEHNVNVARWREIEAEAAAGDGGAEGAAQP